MMGKSQFETEKEKRRDKLTDFFFIFISESKSALIWRAVSIEF